MVNLVATLKKKIIQCTNQQIKSLLLTHLKEEATTLQFVFCKIEAQETSRWENYDPIHFQDQAEQKKLIQSMPLLSLALTYAPNKVCHDLINQLLTIEASEAICLLSKPSHSSWHPLHDLLRLHRTRCIEISSWANKVSKDLVPLLFKDLSLESLFRFCDETAALTFILVLKKLPQQQLIDLFDNCRIIDRPILWLNGFRGRGGLVSLTEGLAANPKILITLLETLGEVFDKKTLYEVLQGEAISVSEKNVFHVLFKSHSPEAISSLMKLLTKFSDKQVLSLLSQQHTFSTSISLGLNSTTNVRAPNATNNSNTSDFVVETPLGLAFARQETIITRNIIAELQKRPALTTLLTKHAIWGAGDNSPMHLAARHGNQEAIAYLLEQPTIPINHNSMINILKTYHHQPILECFAALPLLRCIQNKQELSADKRKQLLNTLLPKLRENPRLLSSRWTHQRTLLHHAVIRGDAITTQFLLEQGIDINATDSDGNTSLQLILSTKNIKLLQLFVLNQKKSKLPAPIILQNFSAALTGLIVIPLTNRQLESLETLFDSQHDNLHQTLQHYCEEQQDAQAALLMSVAKLHADAPNSGLEKAIELYFHEQLQLLLSDKPQQNKQTARLYLLLFLFSLPSETMMSLLKTLTLSTEQRTQLETTLCLGLVKPAFFSQLTLQQHRALLELFSKKSNSLKSIVEVHFRQTDLTLLPTALLQDFIKKLSCQELISHSQHRPTATLILLTLNKALSHCPRNNAVVDNLLIELNKKLTQFNELSCAELRQLLDLTTHPKIKRIIRLRLAELPESSPLTIKISRLFAEFSAKQLPAKTSLLRELFVEFALDSKKIIGNKDARFALSKFLPTLSQQEALFVLKKQQEGLQPAQLITSLLTPAQTTQEDELNNYALSHWLYHLDKQTARINLIPFVQELCEYKQTIDESSKKLSKTSAKALLEALNSLSECLNVLADALSKNQFDLNQSLWEAIQQPLNALIACNRQLSQAFSDANTPLTFSEKNDHHPIQLIELISQKLEIFADTVKKKALALDKQLKKADADIVELFSSAELQPLAALLNVQKTNNDDEALARASMLHTYKTQLDRSNLNECLLMGLLQHPASDALFTAWVQWQLSAGHFTNFEKLYSELPRYLAQTRPAVAFHLNQSLDLILNHAHQALPLLNQLQLLAQHYPSFDDLLNCLLSSDQRTLRHFIALTAKAQLHDLHRLARYVLAGQEHHWGVSLLRNTALSATTNHVHRWLNQSLHLLKAYASSVVSLRALIAPYTQSTKSIEVRLNDVIQVLKDNPFTLDLEAMIQFMQSSKTVFSGENQTISIQAAFVQAFNMLIHQATLENQAMTLDTLEPNILTSLLEYGLSGTTSDNVERARACKTLVTTLCQHQARLNYTAQQLIKNRLNQQDLTLLDDKQLIVIAKSVLEEHHRLQELTVNGVWIQRLLTSPHFMARTTPAVIERLVERYRALSLTLKQDELERLNHWISGKMPFAQRHQISLKKVQDEMLSHPEKKRELLAKRDRLVHFMARDSVRALFNQLEDDCVALKNNDPQLAEDALHVFYTYQSQQVTSLRSDKLFQIANFIYTRSLLNQGDIAVAQNTLLNWLERHLPHRNFQQQELMRKTEVRLYNETGLEIGFLDESNHAMTFIEDEPRNLLERQDTWVEMPLFDQHHQRMGTLTPHGTLARENLFRNETIALIIGKMPMEELQKSAAALNLLLQDCLLENTLKTAYRCEESLPGTEKRYWLEQEISNRIAALEHPITPKTLNTIIQFHSDNSILTLLRTINNTTNAKLLMCGLLTQQKHQLLFHEQYQQDFEQFLTNNDAKAILADFLSQHDKPWFNQGLHCFVEFSKKHNCRDLLSEALLLLNKQTLTDETLQANFDTILQALLGAEPTAKIVLEFISDDLLEPIQQIDANYSDNLSQFFDKCHLVPVLTDLNKKNDWEKSAQHQLLLLILHRQHSRLFPHQELRLSRHQAWQDYDLKQLTQFVVHHLGHNAPHDQFAKVGTQLLSELAFRCANFGQTNLFYTSDGMPNVSIITHKLKRSLLSALAAQFYLPSPIKKAIEKLHVTIKGWFDGHAKKIHEMTQLLKENHAIIDWKELVRASWSETNATEIPLLCAYFMNYSGATAPLRTLIVDIVNSPELLKDRATLHHLTQLMVRFPHRDVSALLFNTLEHALSTSPKIMDAQILHDLAAYHHHCHLKSKQLFTSPQAELALIKHLGQQKL